MPNASSARLLEHSSHTRSHSNLLFLHPSILLRLRGIIHLGPFFGPCVGCLISLRSRNPGCDSDTARMTQHISIHVRATHWKQPSSKLVAVFVCFLNATMKGLASIKRCRTLSLAPGSMRLIMISCFRIPSIPSEDCLIRSASSFWDSNLSNLTVQGTPTQAVNQLPDPTKLQSKPLRLWRMLAKLI